MELDEAKTNPTEGMLLSWLLADIRREEAVEQRKQKAEEGDVNTAGTVMFETNHPCVIAGDAEGEQMDARAFIHMIERLIRWYRHRWEIENRFKKLKHFMVRNASTVYDDRFFIRVLRLVDLLVKLTIDGENRS